MTEGALMPQQRIRRTAVLPLSDDPNVKNVFADFCAGLNVLNGNVHITFASVVADHSEEPAPSRRIVSARIVLPIPGIVEMRDLMTELLDALAAQGVEIPRAGGSTVVTPLRRPR